MTTPLSYIQENWHAVQAGSPATSHMELSLFTDARTTGQGVTAGPLTFINTLAWAQHEGAVWPSVLVRVAHHIADQELTMNMEIGSDHYHGGDAWDEIAALASLATGARFWAGPTERQFQARGDPFGQVHRYFRKSHPDFTGYPSRRAQFPKMMRHVPLERLAMLEQWLQAPVTSFNVLLKSARLYQDALWTAEAEPERAWLLLVSAVEAASVEWDTQAITARDAMKSALPKVHDVLERLAPDAIDETAAALQHLTRATRKFSEFLTVFAPDPPDNRCADWIQFEFSEENIRKAASKIYAHRSKALHGGIGFPAPMCAPPTSLDSIPPAQKQAGEIDPMQEVPMGLASATKGASWQLAETPMLLWTFEHLARGSILNWWKTRIA